MTGATALPQGRGARSDGQRIPRPGRRAGQRRRLGCRRPGPCDARAGRRHRHDGGRPGAAAGQAVHAGSDQDAHTEMCASCHGPRMPGPRYGQAAGCKGTRPDATRREHPYLLARAYPPIWPASGRLAAAVRGVQIRVICARPLTCRNLTFADMRLRQVSAPARLRLSGPSPSCGLPPALPVSSDLPARVTGGVVVGH